MLSVYTRHLIKSDGSGTTVCGKTDIHDRRCRCPKWIRGTLPGSGVAIRKSSGAYSWEQAEQVARRWEQEAINPALKRTTIADACLEFVSNKDGQKLSKAWVDHMVFITEQLKSFASEQGFLFLDQLTVSELIKFRSTWGLAPLTTQVRQTQLSSLFKFFVERGFIQSNPIKLMGRINVKQKPTDYFTPEEYNTLLAVTYDEKYWIHNHYQRIRIRALIELLRYSGLRIGDATSLKRERLVDGKLFLYTQKTGVPVYIPLPPHVVNQLESLFNEHNKEYFFWSGNGAKENSTKALYSALRLVFERAGLVKRCHPQMFRDTFAVELLLSGVPLDQVSLLLGHSSVKTTEKHYAPFVKARQEQIAASAMKAWPKPKLEIVGKQA